jgi:hypothetical protein
MINNCTLIKLTHRGIIYKMKILIVQAHDESIGKTSF